MANDAGWDDAVAPGRKGYALEEPLEQVVLHDELRRHALILGAVADNRLELHGVGGMLGMLIAHHKVNHHKVNTFYFKYGLPIMLVIDVVAVAFLVLASL